MKWILGGALAVLLIAGGGYFLLRGRARCCGVKLSPRYPMVEAIGGVLSLAILEAIVFRLPPDTSLARAGATYVGEGETARLVKLCHNLFLGVVTQALVEVTVLAEKGGVSREAFLRYLNASVLGSTFTRYKAPQLVNTDYRATFTTNLLHKDFDLGLAAARELRVPLPLASLVQQLVMTLVSLGYGEEDFAALLELQGRNSGLEVASEQAEVPDGLSGSQ